MIVTVYTAKQHKGRNIKKELTEAFVSNNLDAIGYETYNGEDNLYLEHYVEIKDTYTNVFQILGVKYPWYVEDHALGY